MSDFIWGLSASGLFRRVATVMIFRPFWYSSSGYILMVAAMIITLGLEHLKGLRPRSPLPRVTISLTYPSLISFTRAVSRILSSISRIGSGGFSMMTFAPA